MISLSSYASAKGIQSMDNPNQSDVDELVRHLEMDYPSSPMVSNCSERERAFYSQVAEELKMYSKQHNIQVLLPCNL